MGGGIAGLKLNEMLQLFFFIELLRTLRLKGSPVGFGSGKNVRDEVIRTFSSREQEGVPTKGARFCHDA